MQDEGRVAVTGSFHLLRLFFDDYMLSLADDRYIMHRLNELRGFRNDALRRSGHPMIMAALTALGSFDAVATGVLNIPGSATSGASPTTDAAIDLAQLAYSGNSTSPSRFRTRTDPALSLTPTGVGTASMVSGGTPLGIGPYALMAPYQTSPTNASAAMALGGHGSVRDLAPDTLTAAAAAAASASFYPPVPGGGISSSKLAADGSGGGGRDAGDEDRAPTGKRGRRQGGHD